MIYLFCLKYQELLGNPGYISGILAGTQLKVLNIKFDSLFNTFPFGTNECFIGSNRYYD